MERSERRLTVLVVVATAVFAIAGIGSPLLGLSVFADTGSLSAVSGYRDVLAGVEVRHNYQRDLVDSAMPNSILFGEALRSGDFAAWNPYALGGAPLGGTPNLAIASPVSLPYWVLPGWLAPAYVRLLELICAIGGTVLFLRRLRLSAAAAWLGGLVFASSAFMVAWSGWPQTRVACLVPALFWAVERLAQRPRPLEVVLVALPVAGMLLGGFPAVTGYALLTAAVYLLVRVMAAHPELWRAAAWRGGAWRTSEWRAVVGRFAAAAAGITAGVGLAAWQLVPWVNYMASVFVSGRAQGPQEHILAAALLTTIAPFAFGTVNPARAPDWFGPLELVDAQSYVGAAAIVLVVTSLALASASRRLLPRGVWWFLVGSAAAWAVAIYDGGPLLELAQRSSFLFSDNFVGRARSVLGFLLAVLAATGFEAVRRSRAHHHLPAAGANLSRGSSLRRLRLAYAMAIWAGAAAGGILLYLAGRRVAARAAADRDPAATGPDLLNHLNGELLIGLLLVLAAVACVGWLWWGRGPRTTVSATLVLLIAAQALWWVQSYHPRTDREAFYPRNPTQAFLAEHLGHQRYFGSDGAIFGSVDTPARLRAFHGHGFMDKDYAELASLLPGEQIRLPTTAIASEPSLAADIARHPVLDRAAVYYFVVPDFLAPIGDTVTQPTDGGVVELVPGQSVTVAVPGSGGVRGVGVTPVAQSPARVSAVRPSGPIPDEATRLEQPAPARSPATSAHVRVTLRDKTGRVVTTGERRGATSTTATLNGSKLKPADPSGGELDAGSPWFVPLAAEDVPAGQGLTAEITALGTTPLAVTGHDGAPAVSAVPSADDGLRLVYARETVIYERTHALDRARWASSVVVEPDPQARLDLLASGTLTPDEVVLHAPGDAADGRPAQVSWVADGLDEMVLSVRAEGAGYLVLADAIQTGWRVSVDGTAAELVPAEHGFVAVAMPAGEHTIRFFYPAPLRGPGAWITGLTIAALLAALLTPALRVRQR